MAIAATGLYRRLAEADPARNVERELSTKGTVDQRAHRNKPAA